jgi:hypothetical protein
MDLQLLVHVAAVVETGERISDGQLHRPRHIEPQPVRIALALDLRVHAGLQLKLVQRPVQIVVHAHVQRAHQARLVFRVRHDENRDLPRALEGPQLRTQPQTVVIQQVEAHDEKVDILFLRQRDDLGRLGHR